MEKMAEKVYRVNADKWLKEHEELRKFILTFSYSALCGIGFLYTVMCVIAKIANA